MPSKLTTWIAAGDAPALGIARGDALTVIEGETTTELTLHRRLAQPPGVVATLARAGVLQQVSVGPDAPKRPAAASPRVLPFGVLRDRRRSPAPTG